MISVREATEYVAQWAKALPAAEVRFDDAIGLQLAEPVVSSVDSPPFDKSMLDGYAVSIHDQAPQRKIIEEVLAGGVPHHAVVPGATIRVMTGAPTPDGADAVIKHEDTKLLNDSTVEIPAEPLKESAGIMRRGEAFHSGQQLLDAGKRLTPIDLALLAEIGQCSVRVIPRPRVAVLSTGNELVECGTAVGPGQITNSNGPLLQSTLQAVHAKPIDLGICRDDPDRLREAMSEGLEADILLVTGGVSAGVMDLVPGVLEELGVKQVFHKVKMKPGKPIWFGVREREDRRTLVFGLPGNPVSALVGMELFVKPALRALSGEVFAPPRTTPGVLTTEIGHKGGRPTYYPCSIDFENRDSGRATVATLPWRGSADLAALTRANALVVLPDGDYVYEPGQEVEVIIL